MNGKIIGAGKLRGKGKRRKAKGAGDGDGDEGWEDEDMDVDVDGEGGKEGLVNQEGVKDDDGDGVDMTKAVEEEIL